jgi:hypothetical protein
MVLRLLSTRRTDEAISGLSEMRERTRTIGEWKPILVGPLRARAVRSIRAIAAAVCDLPVPMDRGPAAKILAFAPRAPAPGGGLGRGCAAAR